VFGVDLSTGLDDPATADTICKAFIDRRVLVFRDQQIDRVQHKAFGRLFGELAVHPSRSGPDVDDPEIFIVRADETSRLNNGGLWHTDLSCNEIPPLASSLLLTEAPRDGGDTLFADMHRAFETLSSPIRTMLLGLTAIHDQRRDIARYGYEPTAGVDHPVSSHPVVIQHPATGLPLLYVNRAFTTRIEQLGELESDRLLGLLVDHIAGSPALHCRVRWEPGTLTIWDNLACQHYAVWDYRPDVRVGERVTIAGGGRPLPSSLVAS
jgi:taurine dioxygenase